MKCQLLLEEHESKPVLCKEAYTQTGNQTASCWWRAAECWEPFQSVEWCTIYRGWGRSGIRERQHEDQLWNELRKMSWNFRKCSVKMKWEKQKVTDFWTVLTIKVKNWYESLFIWTLWRDGTFKTISYLLIIIIPQSTVIQFQNLSCCFKFLIKIANFFKILSSWISYKLKSAVKGKTCWHNLLII